MSYKTYFQKQCGPFYKCLCGFICHQNGRKSHYQGQRHRNYMKTRRQIMMKDNWVVCKCKFIKNRDDANHIISDEHNQNIRKISDYKACLEDEEHFLKIKVEEALFKKEKVEKQNAKQKQYAIAQIKEIEEVEKVEKVCLDFEHEKKLKPRQSRKRKSGNSNACLKKEEKQEISFEKEKKNSSINKEKCATAKRKDVNMCQLYFQHEKSRQGREKSYNSANINLQKEESLAKEEKQQHAFLSKDENHSNLIKKSRSLDSEKEEEKFPNCKCKRNLKILIELCQAVYGDNKVKTILELIQENESLSSDELLDMMFV